MIIKNNKFLLFCKQAGMERVVQQKSTEYPYQTVVELTARPKDGWVFMHWEQELSGTSNPETLYISEEKTVTAVFRSIDELLSIEIRGEGAVRIDQQAFEDNPSRRSVLLSPVPAEGWKFSNWSGDFEGVEDPVEIILDRKLNVTANFNIEYGEMAPGAYTYTTEGDFGNRPGTMIIIQPVEPIMVDGYPYMFETNDIAAMLFGVPMAYAFNVASNGAIIGAPFSHQDRTVVLDLNGSYDPSTSELIFDYIFRCCGFDNAVMKITANFEEIKDTHTEVVDVTSLTGRVWMDRNLGASRAATSSTDEQAYGDLYQWGREADGHQRRDSPATSTLSSTDHPGHGSFILSNAETNWDWRSPQNDNLWQGVNGINNPCPAGYRLPTDAELNSERNTWSSNNAAGAFASPLKLPVAGRRVGSTGLITDVGFNGQYWSSTVSDSRAQILYFYSTDTAMGSFSRAVARSVRCLKD